MKDTLIRIGLYLVIGIIVGFLFTKVALADIGGSSPGPLPSNTPIIVTPEPVDTPIPTIIITPAPTPNITPEPAIPTPEATVMPTPVAAPLIVTDSTDYTAPFGLLIGVLGVIAFGSLATARYLSRIFDIFNQ